MKKYKSRLTDELFDTLREIEEHLDLMQVEGDYELYYDIIEDNTIDDTPEPSENLDEKDSISEEELRNLSGARIAVDKYLKGELYEVEEKQLLSRLMGQTTGKAHDKAFEEKVTTKNAFQKSYQHIIESLQDPESTVCVLCGQEWKQIAQEEATILSEEKSKVGIPLMRIMHIKGKHVPIWNLIAELFGMPAEKIPDARVSTTPNPENVSATNPEELAREELSEAINNSPELRSQFFKKWLEKLQKRE